jgi:hypothetical protein
MTRELAGEWAKLLQAYADGKDVVSDFETYKNPFVPPFEKLEIGICKEEFTNIPMAYKIKEEVEE